MQGVRGAAASVATLRGAKKPGKTELKLVNYQFSQLEMNYDNIKMESCAPGWAS